VAHSEAASILAVARDAGIDTLDTAVGYGDSESRLGALGVSDLKVVSKLPAVPDAAGAIESFINETVEASLRRLKISSLAALLLHRPMQLRERNGDVIYDALQLLKAQGLVEKIGVSVYGPDQLTALSQYHFDIVQAPLNVIDRRLVMSGWLGRLHESGTEVHVRSVFLQGVLLTPPDRRPTMFDRWHSLFAAWDAWVAARGITPVAASLAFALSFTIVSRVVVGVETREHLIQILESATTGGPIAPDGLASDALDLVDPTRWSEQ
jgi:aryl-alcohol dehydrogenase-like predicted oxidoreductase